MVPICSECVARFVIMLAALQAIWGVGLAGWYEPRQSRGQSRSHQTGRHRVGADMF